ncbi:MAG TPA: ribosome-associated translation inhibitor RaiA [Candidatus Saccharimonadales bacterium]|nr:ribosome-associated translation inhibitor RaiA [Candidatus Saccharimonadales bacterium]
MSIVVKGKHLNENQALQDYATKKSQKFYRYFPEIIRTEIELRSEKAHKDKETDFIVNIVVKIPKKTLKISDQAGDMYAAIDKACDRMNEILRREKDWSKGRSRRSLRNFSIRSFDPLFPIRAINKRLFRR